MAAVTEPPAVPERLYLIGFRGSGKSTAGKLVAAKLGWVFLDSDELIEQRTGRTIAALFASEGETAFRNRETELLTGLAKLKQRVIACGGGVVLRTANRVLLRDTGYCVWLTAATTTLHDRITADPGSLDRRPALTGLPPLSEIEALTRAREPLYREVAHAVVDTEGRAPEEVAMAILSSWTG